MSDQQKRGFRLPWAADRAPEDGAAAATMDPAALDPAAAAGDDVDNGYLPGNAASAKTTDAAPATSDVPEVTAEADMIDTESALRDRIGNVVGDDAWSTTEASGAAHGAAEAPSQVRTAATRTPRRDNPLVAGLVKAMREAAIASRAETTNRLQAEVSARVEAIRAEATTEAAALRKRVDEDIAGIRDWSKGEMARIRQETEERIEARRSEAIAENEHHSQTVEQMIQRVESNVTAYETNMDRFFERLLAEEDPAALATLAEQAPDAPDLSGEVTSAAWVIADAPDVSVATESIETVATETTDATGAPAASGDAWGDVAWAGDGNATIGEAQDEPAATAEPFADATAEADAAEAGTVESQIADDAQGESTTETVEGVAETVDAETVDAETVDATAGTTEADGAAADGADGLEASAAAEAEAEATEGLDMSAGNEWPAAVLAAARRKDEARETTNVGSGHSRLLVNGLTSVAGISAFKGALGQLPGVRSVSVSSGERGVFIFTVSHEPETDIAAAVTSLTNFAVQVTETDGENLSVTAHEPAA